MASSEKLVRVTDLDTTSAGKKIWLVKVICSILRRVVHSHGERHPF